MGVAIHILDMRQLDIGGRYCTHNMISLCTHMIAELRMDHCQPQPAFDEVLRKVAYSPGWLDGRQDGQGLQKATSKTK